MGTSYAEQISLVVKVMHKKLLPWLVAISLLAATVHFNLSYSDNLHKFNLLLQSELKLTGRSK
jgi:hypothetical protein